MLPGYYADVILVDGNPLEDIELLQDVNRIHTIVINGHVHKNTEGNNARPRRVPEKTILPIMTAAGTVDWQLKARLAKREQPGK